MFAVTHEMETVTDIENIEPVMAFIERHAEIIGNSKVARQLLLVGEELAVNIFSYAYDGEPGAFALCLRFDTENRLIEMTFRDSGKEYNPLEAPSPDTGADISERKTGGMGIMMALKLTDEQKYIRENGENIFTVIKKY